MPRPKKTNRPIEKKLSIPEDLVVQIDLLLWSELEQRVPYGAWAGFVENALRTALAQQRNAS